MLTLPLESVNLARTAAMFYSPNAPAAVAPPGRVADISTKAPRRKASTSPRLTKRDLEWLFDPRCIECGRKLKSPESIFRGIGPCCEAARGEIESPFVIVIDSNETIPYTFDGLRDTSSRGNAIILPRIVREPLWSQGLADYTIQGREFEIQIERKSLDDLYTTFGARRDEFEQEIARLNQWCEIAYLLIEAEWSEILSSPPRRSQVEPLIISRTYDSWTQKYPKVHWVTCAGRDHAMHKCYRLLEMFHRRKQHEMKRAEKRKAAI